MRTVDLEEVVLAVRPDDAVHELPDAFDRLALPQAHGACAVGTRIGAVQPDARREVIRRLGDTPKTVGIADVVDGNDVRDFASFRGTDAPRVSHSDRRRNVGSLPSLRAGSVRLPRLRRAVVGAAWQRLPALRLLGARDARSDHLDRRAGPGHANLRHRPNAYAGAVRRLRRARSDHV